ncbi:adenylate cyclase type 9-like [Diadema setosum]|uniref:adenylate cyclase type 9-like n=1 Tax=Diadema setosum TaxID=31175 RepID=UPI003B3A9C60
MKTYFIAGRAGSASPATKPHVKMAALESQGAVEDTDSDRGEGAEGRQETQSRKPLLSASTNGANGSGGTPEKARASPGSMEQGKDAVQNHAEVPAGGEVKPENGGVVGEPGHGPSSPQDGPNEESPLTLNESIILHHNEENNTEKLMISFLKENSNIDYFHKVPISNLTLRFVDKEIEQNYHDQFTPEYLHEQCEDEQDEKRRNRRRSSETISTTRYNTLLDVSIAFTMFMLIGIGCFMALDIALPWAVCFPIVTVLQLVVLLAVVREAFCRGVVLACAECITLLFHQWYRRHIVGALLLSCPILAVYTNYTCGLDCFGSNRLFFCFLLIVSLLHFCNFVQLNLWMKMLLALFSGVILLILLFICNACDSLVDPDIFGSTPTPYGLLETTATTEEEMCEYKSLMYVIPEELVLVIILLLVLIFLLNREYEIGFRLNYYAKVQASADRERMQLLQQEAESLLHHIVPQFVTEQLRTTKKFSQNHENVAVIFCSIVNFNDFYEEAYEGGKECIRVLHELISDFDNLLGEPMFEEVEKIKTIGSTYMAACGLHPRKQSETEAQSIERLVTLMDFAQEMMNKISQFNEDVLSMTIGAFNFILRIGYNHGKLTSGVIGTTKLLYDIWGDTVNVASRMDSTGVPGRIQVTEHSMKVLEPFFEFEQRGLVKVRGKGEMMTYLVKSKKATPLEPTS